MPDTIFALSSGALPAAIAVLRISGTKAGPVGEALAGTLPPEREARLRTLRSASGQVLDSALLIWFPGPDTATGEDCIEIHAHGGRAVVARLAEELRTIGLREARPGEFTQRAFANGRMDLLQVEALGDLLSAETELQRRIAQESLHGEERPAHAWRREVLQLSAVLEASIDFADEDDVDDTASVPPAVHEGMRALQDALSEHLSRPTTQRLREGVRIALAGPPNSGKSTLFNALVRDAAALTSPIAGTTRDVLERSIALGGVPITLLDTAGLRSDSLDAIEQAGIARARHHIDQADIVLWLGPEGEGPSGALEIESMSDRSDRVGKQKADHTISALTGEGMAEFETALADKARQILPKPGQNAFSERQRDLAQKASLILSEEQRDPLLVAEQLRTVRMAFDMMIGYTSTEEMLDTLFAGFCIGK